MDRARPYQLELYGQARAGNVIAYLDTGSGKTLVSVLLMQDYARELRPISVHTLQEFQKRKLATKGLRAQMQDYEQQQQQWKQRANGKGHSKDAGASLAVMDAEIKRLSAEIQAIENGWKAEWPVQPQKVILLVPTVPLVTQQANAIRSSSDLVVGVFSGDSFSSSAQVHWDYFQWQYEIARYQVLAMTPQICLNLLRHGLLSMSGISLLIFDECHHAIKNNPYNAIMREFYHPIKKQNQADPLLPKIFGMTASPIVTRFRTHADSLEKLMELQQNLDCTILTIRDRTMLEAFVARASETIVEYAPPPDALLNQCSPQLNDVSVPSVGMAVDRSQPQTASLAYYLFHARSIITMRNAATNPDTLNKMDRMIGLVQDIKNDLGLWCAGVIAESYVLATVQSSTVKKVGNRKRKLDDVDATSAEDVDDNNDPPMVELEARTDMLFIDQGLPSLAAVEFLADLSSPQSSGKASFRSLSFRFQFSLPAERPRRPTFLQIRDTDFTPKVQTALRLLREYSSRHNETTFRAMIFVSRRLHAKVLADLINLCAPELFPIIKASHITGHGSSSAYRSKMNTEMNSHEQNLVLNQFRRGAINMLVVTSVGEEGLDVPACNLVVVMDGLRTAGSYVQSRGRARNMESAYVVMNQRGNIHQLEMIANAKTSEKLIRQACKDLNLKEIACDNSHEEDNSLAETLVGRTEHDAELAILSTGARLSIHSAVDILNRYTSSLHGSASSNGTVKTVEYLDAPPDAYTSGRYGHIVDVRLPRGSPLSNVLIRGSQRLTKRLAIQSAAFQACRLLYERGALDDHLLSMVDQKSKLDRRKRRRLTGSMNGLEDDEEVNDASALDFYRLNIPCIFQRSRWEDLLVGSNVLMTVKDVQRWAEGIQSVDLPTLANETISLHVTYLAFDVAAIAFIDPPKERPKTAIALFTRDPLPRNLPPIWLFVGKERDQSAAVTVSTSRSVEISADEWNLIRDYQLKLYSYVMNDGADGKDGKDDVNRERMYKLLPAIETLDGEFQIDWDATRSFLKPQKHRKFLDYIQQENGISLRQLSEKQPVPGLEQLIATVPFNGRRFFLKQMDPERLPDTELETNRLKDGAPKTYREYAETKYRVTVRYGDLPLIEAKGVPGIRNYLQTDARRNRGGGQPGSSSPSVFLIPETCEIVALSQATFRLALLLPSVMQQLEIYLLAEELRLEVMKLPQLSLMSVLEASTAPSMSDHFNYQRLETLGDSILKHVCSIELYQKYPGMDEGALTQRRSRLVNNKGLCQRALQLGMEGYLFVTPFFPRQWAPPGIRPWRPFIRQEEGAPEKSMLPEYRAVGGKTVADFVEALIAACYVDGGLDLSREFLRFIGVLNEFAIASSSLKLAETPVITVPIPASPPTYDMFAPLQQLLDYEFKNPMLLVEAFTHISYHGATTASYERLEFLGDAALDLLITRHFFQTYRNCTPAQLTDLRQTAVNNESFGRIAVESSLHSYLLHSSPSLADEIQTYVNWYLAPGQEVDHKMDDPNEMEQEGPKVLSDMFESLCGAILADTGMDEEKTWTIVYPLCRSFFERHCDLETLQKHPVRSLYELAQRHGYEHTDIQFQMTDLGSMLVQCELLLKGKTVASSQANTRPVAKRLAAIQVDAATFRQLRKEEQVKLADETQGEVNFDDVDEEEDEGKVKK